LLAREKKKKYPCENQKSTTKDASMSQYSVRLNQEQRKGLEHLVKSGVAPARKIMHAQILLKVDQGWQGPHWSVKQVQEAFTVSDTLIRKVKKRFVEEGLEAALNRKKQPERPEKRKINGRQEARIIATICTERPEGQERWTIRALTTRIIELEIVEEVGRETVRAVLHKNKLKPWLQKEWCIGPVGDGEYVYHMEDVLDVHEQPYDPKKPSIGIDEGSFQLVGDKQDPLAMKPGSVKKIGYEYERNGFCNVFLMIEPLTGKIVTEVTERRTKRDFAHFLKKICDEVYPDAEKLVLVLDNLNTHTPGSLYQTFSKEEAKRLTERLEIHYTPKHGSWLNMAEIGLSVLSRQALSERTKEIELVREKVAAWQAKREKNPLRVNWQFTTHDARIKLKYLYPKIEGDEEEPEYAQ
jgi:transposase